MTDWPLFVLVALGVLWPYYLLRLGRRQGAQLMRERCLREACASSPQLHQPEGVDGPVVIVWRERSVREVVSAIERLQS